MRSVWFLAAAVVIGVSALTAGCGQQTAGPAAGGPSGSPASATGAPASSTPVSSTGAPAPSTGPPAAAACGSATPTSPPNRTLTLSTGDAGRSFCIKPGVGVLIYLKGTPTAKWATLKSSSAVMVPRANGHLALALGVTGGFFVAAKPGVATITSSRGTQTFQVTVRVAG
jgi:hypothetical protein